MCEQRLRLLYALPGVGEGRYLFLDRRSSALPLHSFLELELLFLVPPVVIERRVFLERRNICKLVDFVFDAVPAYPLHYEVEVLVSLFFVAVKLDQPLYDLGRVPRRDFYYRRGKTGIVPVKAAAHEHLLGRHIASVPGQRRTLEAYARRDVLRAGVRAARDLYPEVFRKLPEFSEPVAHARCEVVRQTLGGGYSEPARVRPRASRDVTECVGSRVRKISVPERGVKRRERRLRHPPEYEVLQYRDTELACGIRIHYICQSPRFVRLEIAQMYPDVYHRVIFFCVGEDARFLPLDIIRACFRPLRRRRYGCRAIGRRIVFFDLAEVVVPYWVRLQIKPFFFYPLFKLVPAEAPDEELHARLHPHLALPVAVEDTYYGGGKRYHFLDRQKFGPEVAE